MKWKIVDNGTVVIDESEKLVCTFPGEVDSFHKTLIKYAPQMFNALMEYIECYESVPPKTPKKVFDNIKKVVDLLNDSSE